LSPGNNAGQDSQIAGAPLQVADRQLTTQPACFRVDEAGSPAARTAVSSRNYSGAAIRRIREQGGRIMLVLTRKFGESIVIGDSVTVTVMEVKGERVRLGISAPAEVPVHREEVLRKIESGLFQ
jgi:carbon storage regulator